MKNYNYKEIVQKELDISKFYTDYGFSLNGKNQKCCFHDDSNPSLSINPQNGLFKCHACGKSGSIFDWYMLHHNVDFKEAVIQIAEKYNIELPRSKESKKEGGKKDKLTDELIEACYKALPEDIRTYLNNRGIPDKLIEKYKLGWGEFYEKYWITIPIKGMEGKYALVKLRRNPLEETKNDN